MALRSVRAFIHNQTDKPLTKLSDECPHGEWTTRAPDRIEANSVAMMRVASKLFGNVESRATYQIGNDRNSQLYVHWNNPAGAGNTYHTNTDGAHYAFFSAPGTGSDPEAHYFLRPAGRFETDFLPSRDGFQFTNHWDNTPYSLPPLRGSLLDNKYGNASNGLCGGMVLGARDYFLAGQEIPSTTTPPPGEPDKLFDYLVDRLFATFSVNAVTLLLKLMDPLYPDTDENILNTFGLASGRAAVMALQEWPLIRGDIDAGRPSPVCVITVKSLNPGDLGKNHQLLAYAYDGAGHDVRVHLYDPNQPNDTNHPNRADNIYMRFNDADVAHRIVVEHNISVEGRPVYCFVRMDGDQAPLPFNTRHRLTRDERKARRVHLLDPKYDLIGSVPIKTDKRLFDVWPDCGQHMFKYIINQDTWRTTLTATTPYYREPKLTWTVNGLVLAPGTTDVLVYADPARPDDAPARISPPPDSGKVKLHVTVSVNQLEIVNDPDDGNYTLAIQLTAREGNQPDTLTRVETAVDIVGLDEVVPGLEEARAACWKGYLDLHRAGEPSLSSVAAALYSQLGRPGDPIWDPDPDSGHIGALVATADPAVAKVMQWQQEALQAARATTTVAGTTHIDTAALSVLRQIEINHEIGRLAFEKAKLHMDHAELPDTLKVHLKNRLPGTRER